MYIDIIKFITSCYNSVNSFVFFMLIYWVDAITYRLKILDWLILINNWVLGIPIRKLVVIEQY